MRWIEQIAARPERPLGGAQPAASPFPATGTAVEAMGSPHEFYLLRGAWASRDDRYSERRSELRQQQTLHKIEMHYIGG